MHPKWFDFFFFLIWGGESNSQNSHLPQGGALRLEDGAGSHPRCLSGEPWWWRATSYQHVPRPCPPFSHACPPPWQVGAEDVELLWAHPQVLRLQQPLTLASGERANQNGQFSAHIRNQQGRSRSLLRKSLVPFSFC